MVIGICDDEPYYLDAIIHFVKKWQAEQHPDLVLSLKSYETAEALIIDWENGLRFDLLFLDVRLPSTSGLRLAEKIRKVDPHVPIVFITNHEQYAARGYEVNAYRFLIKPIAYKEQVYPCLEYAHSLLFQSNQPDLYVIKNGASVRLFLQKIVSITCNHHQVLITIAETPEPYFIRLKGSFDDFLLTIPAPFFIRCHQSHAINAMYIESLFHNEIHMLNGQIIPISRAYSKEVLTKMRNYTHGGLLS